MSLGQRASMHKLGRPLHRTRRQAGQLRLVDREQREGAPVARIGAVAQPELDQHHKPAPVLLCGQRERAALPPYLKLVHDASISSIANEHSSIGRLNVVAALPLQAAASREPAVIGTRKTKPGGDSARSVAEQIVHQHSACGSEGEQW